MKKHVTKILAIILALALALSLAACGSSDTSNASTNVSNTSSAENNAADAADGRRTIRVGDITTFASLSPFAAFTTRGGVDYALYENLARMDDVNGPLTGILAKNWETTDGGLTYIIELYDNIYDSAGNHITSSDIIFCYEEYARTGAGLPLKMKSLTAIDDTHLELVLVDNQVGNLEQCMTFVYIVDEDAYKASSDGMASAPISTSHYIVTDYVSGAYVTLEKNENYWQTDESLIGPGCDATFDEVTYVTIQEAAQMTIALETGTIDAAIQYAGDEIDKFLPGGQYADQFSVHAEPLPSTYALFLSGDESSLVSDDLNLRRAIAHAVDREGVIQGMMNGHGIPIGIFATPSQKGFPTNADETTYEYNVDLAKEYLAKSNYNGEPVRILTGSMELWSRFGQIVASYLEAIGMKTELMAYDSALYQTYFPDPTKWDIALCSTGAVYNSDSWIQFLSAAGNNGEKSLHGWQDPELEAAIMAASNVETFGEETTNEASRIINENAYIIGLFYTENYHVYNNNLGISEISCSGNVAHALFWEAK